MFYHKLIPVVSSSPSYPVHIITPDAYYAITTSYLGNATFAYRTSNNYLYSRSSIGGAWSLFTGGGVSFGVVNIHFVDNTNTLCISEGHGAYKYHDTAWHSSTNGGTVNMCSDAPRETDIFVTAHRYGGGAGGSNMYPRVQSPYGRTNYPSTNVDADCPSVASSSLMPRLFSGGGACSVLFANLSGPPRYSLEVNHFLTFLNVQTIAGIGNTICCDQTPDGSSAIIAEQSGSIYGTSTGLSGSWSELTNFPTTASWLYCEISDNGGIIASTSTNLYYSPDFGATVYDVTTESMTGLHMCTISGNGQYGYVACDSGVFMVTFY